MNNRGKVIYLTNKDLLEQIHQSKNAYCEYTEKKYHRYDLILENRDDVFKKKNLKLAKETRAIRLAQEAFQIELDKFNKNEITKKPKLSDFEVNPKTIAIEDLVFRIYTFEHIPLAPGRKKTPKKEADKYVKLNFTPFKHYTIINKTELLEVGRSHSKDQQFSLSHGQMTPALAKMLILLVEKYSQSANWRSYCVDQETEALSQRGWLKGTEINETDKILSYTDGDLKWSNIKSIYRNYDYDGLMHKLTVTGYDSLITPGHKLLTKRGLIPVENLGQHDRLILMGNAVKTKKEKVYSDDLVQLLGWIVTEGTYLYDEYQKIKSISLFQNEGPKADRIRTCIRNLNFTYTEKNKSKGGKCLTFYLYRKHSKELHKIMPSKVLPMEFIMALTEEQRELLINTMIDGDGWRSGKNKELLRYCQKNKEHIDTFQALCTMSGKRSNTHYVNQISFGKPTSCYIMNIFTSRSNTTNGECVNMHGGKRGKRGTHFGCKNYTPHQPTTPYKGLAWCPETEYGSFMARRNGTIYLTGNSYNDEFRGQALLQLSQVALQFNELLSSQAFSYLTQISSNSFTRILNIEKQNQNTRDDLLQSQGKAPSFTRQLDHEEAVRKQRESFDLSSED